MDKKSRNERMKEFYKRKVERLEIKNDKLKFHISQIQNEKSDDILMKLYELAHLKTPYDSKSIKFLILSVFFERGKSLYIYIKRALP